VVHVTSGNDAEVSPTDDGVPMTAKVRGAVAALTPGAETLIPGASTAIQFASDVGTLAALAEAYFDLLGEHGSMLSAGIATEARDRTRAAAADAIAAGRRLLGDRPSS
jgi:hypothetical protein